MFNPIASVLSVILPASTATAQSCPGDVDSSGQVGVSDLLQLLGEWGPCHAPGACLSDINLDGMVGVSDLLILLGDWGCIVPESTILTFTVWDGDQGGSSWVTPSNAQADDGVNTSNTIGIGTSDYLIGTIPADTSGIPADAVIIEMEPIIQAQAGDPNAITFADVKFWQSGAIAGNDLSSDEPVTTTMQDFSFGPSLGGLTWTRAQIDTMGVAARFTDVGATAVFVDFLRVRVYWNATPDQASMFYRIPQKAQFYYIPTSRMAYRIPGKAPFYKGSE